MVAEYLFSAGARSNEDLDSIAKTGNITVTRTVTHPVTRTRSKESNKKTRRKKCNSTDVKVEKFVYKIPVEPFIEHSEYRPFALDKWIRGYVVMCAGLSTGHHLQDEHVPIKLAERWYTEMESEAAMRKRIEPMLLTEIGMDVIALDLLGCQSLQPAIEAYERLYYNSRDENWNLNGSMQLIQRMAMPWGPIKTYLKKWEKLDSDGFVIGDGRPICKESDIWRAVAATQGYDALMFLWRWDKRAHGIKDRSIEHMLDISWRVSVTMMMADLFTGDVKHEDVARILAAYTAQSKRISEDRHDGGEGDDTTSALLSVLYAAAPKMRTLVEGGAGMITDNDIQTRIAAQQAIDKTHIQDAGKQVANEVIEAQITEAIER